MLRAFAWIARHGRWCLVFGLAAGLLLPALAKALQPMIPVLIAALLFLAAFRIGSAAILREWRAGFASIWRVLNYQLALPLLAACLGLIFGVLDTVPALVILLLLSAPSISGSPNFAVLMGHDPKGAFRLLLFGTALFPITVLPVLFVLPQIGSPLEVLETSARLAGLIFGAAGLGFVLRAILAPTLSQTQTQAVDGISALLLGVMVIGLMAAAGPLLAEEPRVFWGWLALSVFVNFGLQMVAWRRLRKGPGAARVGEAIVAGNRNIALFLVALPQDTATLLLPFIGCYQVPMFLTPIVLRRFYGRED